MAWYEYVCPECGLIHETQRFAKIGQPLTTEIGVELCDNASCPGVPIRRVSMPQTRPTSEPYFNHNVGTWIKDDADLRRQLKRKAEKNSQLTGTDHNYIPVYPGDMHDSQKQLGVGGDDSESIEHSRRTNPAARPASKSKVIV